jgi:tetratricopeptide (TPR) repeat protein
MEKIFLQLVLLFGFVAGAQNDNDKISKMGDKACECTKDIEWMQPKDSILSQINSCITIQIISEQTDKYINELAGGLEAAVAAQKDTVIRDGSTTTIYVDEGFDEIQQYMSANCKMFQELIASNNALEKNSMSRNKKALKYYNEGEDYYRREQYNLAVVSFNRAVDADPKFAFAWDNMGICQRKMGNYKEAIKCYQKSLEIEPKGTMPLQNMAVAYEYLKEYQKAAETYETFIKLYPGDPEGFYGAGRTYYISGNYEKGVDYMFKAYQLYTDKKSPYVNDAISNLQNYYADLKEKNKLEIFNQAAKNNKIDIKE